MKIKNKNSTVDYTGIYASGDRTSTYQEIDRQVQSMKEECSKKSLNFLEQ
jgi:hypothetical protein